MREVGQGCAHAKCKEEAGNGDILVVSQVMITPRLSHFKQVPPNVQKLRKGVAVHSLHIEISPLDAWNQGRQPLLPPGPLHFIPGAGFKAPSHHNQSQRIKSHGVALRSVLLPVKNII